MKTILTEAEIVGAINDFAARRLGLPNGSHRFEQQWLREPDGRLSHVEISVTEVKAQNTSVFAGDGDQIKAIHSVLREAHLVLADDSSRERAVTRKRLGVVLREMGIIE